MKNALLAVFAVVALVACGSIKRTGTAPTSVIGEGELSHVTLTVANLTKDDAQKFLEQLEDQGNIENIKLTKWEGNTAVYDLDVDGCECELPQLVSQVPLMGFKYEGRTTSVKFSGFDNKPPSISFVHPEEGRVLTERDQYIAVEIPDSDVAEVNVNGVAMSRYKGNIFRVQLKLADGTNDIVVTAKDKSGNEGKATVRVGVDTTPPAVEATVKVVVEGQVEPGSSVLIDGREVEVESNGHYKAEVPIRKGQKTVEIVAIDANGNKNVSEKDIGQ
jgi:hypothetical protein